MYKSFRKIVKFTVITSFIFASNTSTIAAKCSVTSNTLSFGAYDVFSSSPLTSTGSIQVRCSPGTTPYTVSLNNGLYGPITQRKMKNTTGTQTMEYNLYTDATYSVVWGDGTGGGVVVRSDKPDNLTVYGQIPPQQDIPIGTYTDVITVTVSF
ncbi:MAG TPA: spore coat U domain-containing protein [Gammaproteobacteria bacterium]|jgi:spore coat protein U-like protein|nr:spore coat U domain-containing protein [Gammaproteobacteria bacterium]